MNKQSVFTALFLLLPGIAEAQIRCDIPCAKEFPEPEDTITVHIIGDVMMHSRQMEYDCGPFLKDIGPQIKAADISIANMEFTLAGVPYSGYPTFSAPDYYPEYLASLGTDIFLLANNHITDKGKSGLDRTLKQYDHLEDSLGTRHTGTGGDPLVIREKGYSIAFLNFTYGTNGNKDSRVNYLDSAAVARAFNYARKMRADFIVVLPHWGNEYELQHSAYQEKWARSFVEQGADVIVGSHPHVVQDTTHIKGVPVIYSVGNAISNMSATNTRLELAVTLTFVCKNGIKRMLEPELEFLWCTLPGTLTGNYATISVKKWASRESDWLIKDDYREMSETLERVIRTSGIDY